MKIAQLIKNTALALLGLAFACSVTRTEAQSTIITGWTNTFPNNGNTGFYQVPYWIYWYSLYQDSAAPGDYNLAATNDASMDYTGDTNDSGSMYVYAPWQLVASGTGDQNVFDVTFGGSGPFDQSERMQMITVTNISWYIRVASNSIPNAEGNFGTLSG